MKSYQIYDLEKVIGNIITQDNTKRNSILLYKLLKNQAILKSQIETIQKTFDITTVKGYELFQSKRQQIIDAYKEQFKQELANPLTEEQSQKHNFNLTVRLSNLKKQKQLTDFFKQLQVIDNNKINFLNQQYMQDNLKKIKLQQIADLNLSGKQMNVLMNLIQE